MDLFVCGNSPLIQPPACPRYYEDKPNPCTHVPSGQVDANTRDKACPNMAIKPRLVFSPQKRIDIRQTGAENTLTLHYDSGPQVVHCRDGYDRTLEEKTVPLLRDQVSDEDQQDIWIDTKMVISEDDDDFLDDMFGGDYPRGPVVDLGVLHRNGAIYSLKQQPFKLEELTDANIRTPFLHAIFRQECNNGKRDVWPSIVLPHQPNVLFRLRTIEDLLSWLRGEEAQIRRIAFPSPVVILSTSRSRAEQCIAVTESGKVYHWRRDDESAGTFYTSTLQGALSIDAADSLKHSQQGHEDPSRAGYLDMPPTDHVVLGLRMGAAVTRDGALYVFSLRKSTQQDLYTAHIADLDDGTAQHRIPGPFVPKLASINRSGVRFVDAAAGVDHLVALTSEGEVFSVGGGFQGALGIGDKQFELDDDDPRSFEWRHDCVQFSEDWHEVVLPNIGGKKKIVGVAAGYESTMLFAGPP